MIMVMMMMMIMMIMIKREIIMCKAPNRVPRQEEYNA